MKTIVHHSLKKRKDRLEKRVELAFYALLLKNKLYLNTFFLTVHQNVNNLNSTATRTVCGTIFLYFYIIIANFFSFSCQDTNKAESNCAVIGCKLPKKHKLTLYKTRGGEPNYVEHKFFSNILLGAA